MWVAKVEELSLAELTGIAILISTEEPGSFTVSLCLSQKSSHIFIFLQPILLDLDDNYNQVDVKEDKGAWNTESLH